MPRKSLGDQTLDEALGEWADLVLSGSPGDGDIDGARRLAMEIVDGRKRASETVNAKEALTDAD